MSETQNEPISVLQMPTVCFSTLNSSNEASTEILNTRSMFTADNCASVTRNKYSTYIETGDEIFQLNTTNTVSSSNQHSNNRTSTGSLSRPVLNKAICIEPSPSGVTRIHINHIDTKGSRVSDKIKQVNEAFQRQTSRTRSLSPASYHAKQRMLVPPSTSNESIKDSVNNNSVFGSKKDNSTSPIKTFTKNPKLSDAFTQVVEEKRQVSPKLVGKQLAVSSVQTEIVMESKEMAKAKKVLALAKSELVVVNVSPSKEETKPITIEEHQTSRFEQTPVSTSSKSRTNSSQDLILNQNLTNETDHIIHHNLSSLGGQKNTLDMLNCNGNNNNEILNLKTSSYYNDIIKSQNDDNETNQGMTSHFQSYVREPAASRETMLSMSASSRRGGTRQLASKNEKLMTTDTVIDLLDDNENLSAVEQARALESNAQNSRGGGRLSMQVNRAFEETTNSSETSSVRVKRLETFYNGNKVWTATTDIEESSSDEGEENSEKRLIKKESTKENGGSLSKGSNKAVAKSPKEEIVKKKKKTVKINEPLDSRRDHGLSGKNISPKKARHLQKCCFVLFLLFLFFIATAILIYFFAWNLITKHQRSQ